MHKVGLVCDSTCDLGLEFPEAHDVRMIPLKVMIDGETYLDWVELTPAGFYEKLAEAKELPTTSQPSPADFTATYEALAGEGCTDIVSIHLSAPLSGTYQSATIAAETSPIPVRVVDTRLVSVATALVVKSAIETRDAGGDADAIETAANVAAERTRLLFILDTLEYLVKGGRAGKAAGLTASLLNIKPVLTFDEQGTIEPFRKVKGMTKALGFLVEHLAESAGDITQRIAVLHSVSPELADRLLAALDEAGVPYELDYVGSVGAVIGTYAGPGAVGVAFLPAERAG